MKNKPVTQEVNRTKYQKAKIQGHKNKKARNTQREGLNTQGNKT